MIWCLVRAHQRCVAGACLATLSITPAIRHVGLGYTALSPDYVGAMREVID